MAFHSGAPIIVPLMFRGVVPAIMANMPIGTAWTTTMKGLQIHDRRSSGCVILFLELLQRASFNARFAL